MNSHIEVRNVSCSATATGRDLIILNSSSTPKTYSTSNINANINSDEVTLAGRSFSKTNTAFYLNTGTYFWTMTPHSYDVTNLVDVFYIDANGNFNNGTNKVISVDSVRPVISLKANTIFATGNGTSQNPYVVKYI